MSEFQYTMKQWLRMCKMVSCSKCPVNEKCPLDENCASCSELYTDVEIAQIEEAIANWAEEHPEPVYPTWFEFVWCQLAHREPVSDKDLVAWMDNTHIPADIAQKLGLEPESHIKEDEQDG